MGVVLSLFGRVMSDWRLMAIAVLTVALALATGRTLSAEHNVRILRSQLATSNQSLADEKRNVDGLQAALTDQNHTIRQWQASAQAAQDAAAQAQAKAQAGLASANQKAGAILAAKPVGSDCEAALALIRSDTP